MLRCGDCRRDLRRFSGDHFSTPTFRYNKRPAGLSWDNDDVLVEEGERDVDQDPVDWSIDCTCGARWIVRRSELASAPDRDLVVGVDLGRKPGQ